MLFVLRYVRDNSVVRGGIALILALSGLVLMINALPGAQAASAATSKSFHAVILQTSDDTSTPDTAAITNTINALNGWYASQTTPSMQPRWVRDSAGNPVVSVVRLSKTTAHYSGESNTNGEVNAELLNEIQAAGVMGPDEFPVSFLKATSDACGLTTNNISVIYEFDPYCRTYPSSTEGWPYGASYVTAHEMAHAMGAVPDCATHFDGTHHVNDNPSDLLYQGPLPRDWANITLDPGHDDYYLTPSSCPGIETSGFMETAAAKTDSNVKVTYKDSATGAGVPGAIFQIWQSDEATHMSHWIANVGPTNQNGEATYSGLPPGTYYLQESSTPSGYQTNPNRDFTTTAGQILILDEAAVPVGASPPPSPTPSTSPSPVVTPPSPVVTPPSTSPSPVVTPPSTSPSPVVTPPPAPSLVRTPTETATSNATSTIPPLSSPSSSANPTATATATPSASMLPTGKVDFDKGGPGSTSPVRALNTGAPGGPRQGVMGLLPQGWVAAAAGVGLLGLAFLIALGLPGIAFLRRRADHALHAFHGNDVAS